MDTEDKNTTNHKNTASNHKNKYKSIDTAD